MNSSDRILYISDSDESNALQIYQKIESKEIWVDYITYGNKFSMQLSKEQAQDIRDFLIQIL